MTILKNLISNVENNCLTVTAKQPELSESYLNLNPDKETMKIDCKTLKHEQCNDKSISPIFEAISSKNRPSFKDKKLMCRKSLSYFKLLTIIKNK